MANLTYARKEHLHIKKTITVASGIGNSSFLLNKPISHLYVQAPNSSDTFEIYLVDVEGDRLTKNFKAYSDDDGLLSTIWEKNLPTVADFTVHIINASSDGAYKVTVVYPNR